MFTIKSIIMQTRTFTSLNKHIVEFYQSGKFIGHQIHEGKISIDQIGYENKQMICDGFFQLKKKYVATKNQPITLIKYNLNGRYQ